MSKNTSPKFFPQEIRIAKILDEIFKMYTPKIGNSLFQHLLGKQKSGLAKMLSQPHVDKAKSALQLLIINISQQGNGNEVDL